MPDRPPFTSLIDLHGPDISSYLFRMLLDIGEAEDCLQETYLRALRAYPNLKNYTNLRAWLYKIATNQAYTHLKQRNRFARQNTDLDNINLPSNVEIEPCIEQKELLATISRAVSSLPHKQGAALIMRKYQQLSYIEIAEALQCSQESARSSVYQALKKLRAQFKDEKDIYE